MPKKKLEVVEEVKVEEKAEVLKVKPSKIEFNFGNGDLNVLRDKLNEVIDNL